MSGISQTLAHVVKHVGQFAQFIMAEPTQGLAEIGIPELFGLNLEFSYALRLIANR
jgi:hypothetical protein